MAQLCVNRPRWQDSPTGFLQVIQIVGCGIHFRQCQPDADTDQKMAAQPHLTKVPQFDRISRVRRPRSRLRLLHKKELKKKLVELYTKWMIDRQCLCSIYHILFQGGEALNQQN